MTEKQSSYRQIMKATSIFGGVQVFKIIIQIVRSKIIAVLLGPAGFGIIGLLHSTIDLIAGLTNFGLGTSAVKNVAEAHATGKTTRIATVIIVLKRLVWITGTIGAILTAILSPWLSELTFGNSEYTVAFLWVSITLLLKQITTGQLVVLQGLRKIKYLAQANLYGSFTGLILTVPLYYYFGIDAIVPGIIIASVISLGFTWFFSSKIKIENIRVSKVRTIAEGKSMMTMGIMISLSGLIGLGVAYIVRIFISNLGGVSEVGLYNAGFAIINSYVALIFSAMATDYYPRLSAVGYSNKKCKELINQQAEIAILILAPILIVFLVFIKWIIILLYSTKFVGIEQMIHWAALGMLFKAASWAIAFIFLSKGANKLYFANELIANVISLGVNLLGYYFWGLTGLGISFFVGYLLYLTQVFFVSKIKYDFNLNSAFVQIFTIQGTFVTVCFVLVSVISPPYSYFAGSLLILTASWYSLKELNKRIGLMELFRLNKYLRK